MTWRGKQVLEAEGSQGERDAGCPLAFTEQIGKFPSTVPVVVGPH